MTRTSDLRPHVPLPKSLPRSRTGVTLLLICAVVGIPLWPGHAASDPEAPVVASKEPSSDAFSLPPLDALGEVVARPLFMPTRRPPPPTATSSASLLQPPNFALAGIVVVGSRRVAMIETGANATAPFASIAVGDTIDGWTVTAIKHASILLQAGDRTVEVTMRDKAPPWRAPLQVLQSQRHP